MAAKFKNVYQFKITLLNVKPQIWRRIQVPETYRFWDLHCAIQDAMGWEDCHLHEFRVPSVKGGKDLEIGISEEIVTMKSTKVRIANHISLGNPNAGYWYDFGDDWWHKLKLEKILPSAPNLNYPLCLAGKRACPPEDSGGPWRYQHLLDVMKDPKDPEYEDALDWMGEDFDPEKFDPKDVNFDDPRERERYCDFF
ncbi:MAG TPA: plasmid pRiA4b ORF-3 family protein [Candidatus Cloacimonadota bacterium]|nr:plasmid pRiA4b ORF-3 family protein [Candidatus Cloacimonadota bacterium]